MKSDELNNEEFASGTFLKIIISEIVTTNFWVLTDVCYKIN